MKFLLVYSLRDVLTARRPLASLGDIHIGLSYVSAYLKARGHQTRLVVLGSETPKRSLSMLEEAVAEFDPGCVACTAVSTQFPFIKTAACRLKQRWPGKFLLLGGVHASLSPEDALNSDFDAVCVGEGEAAAAELADCLEAGRPPRGLANIWVKLPDGSIEKNRARDFLSGLETLPAPDRGMWHPWIMARRLSNQVILPSRGCPYNCSYCSNHALRKLAGGRYVRFRPPLGIVDEIRVLKERYPETTHVYLQSETIAVNADWLDALADGLEALNAKLETKISFTCNFRVAKQFVNERVFGALARANVKTIEIGLESGSERIRCEVLRRHYTNAEFLQAVALAKQHGMQVNVYNMIGLPGESVADHWETIQINRQVCPNRSPTSIFFPYPGTDLFTLCQQRGWLTQNKTLTAERTRATLDLPDFPRAEIQRAYDWFEYRVYEDQRPWHFRWRKMLRNKAHSRTWSHAVFMRLLPLWHSLRRN